MRATFPLLALVGSWFLLAGSTPAQDEKEKADKRAIQILLDKAEDEYRTFFRRPETTFEFWAAIKFEIDVGKFDLAAFHLKRLLTNDKVPAEKVDADLFKIETVEGMASLLRLLRVQRWSDHPPIQKEAEENVKLFFERLSAVVEKNLGDPERIRKFIRQLDASTVEERIFAFKELNRSRERAIPYVIENLRESVGQPLFQRIIEAMVNFDPETVPAYLEVLKARDAKDAQDQELRLILLRILRKRGDERVVPYLWHLSASPQYPLTIRTAAKEMLGEFEKVDPEVLPPAKLVLTQMAERYYKHQVKIPQPFRLWKWDGEKVATEPVELKPADVEEFFGLRHAREALDLDPTFAPAQLAFLNLIIERTVLLDYEEAILRPLPSALQRLLASVDSDLLMRALERAADEANIPVLLGAVQALGSRGETRAATPTAGKSRGIVRALSFPDRRVQYAAAMALLRMPTSQTPVAAARIVEVLRRLLVTDQPPAALVVGAAMDKANEVVQSLRQAGLETIQAKTIKEGLEKCRSRGNIDLVLLHYGMPERELPFALDQLRGDPDFGLTPILVIVPEDEVAASRKLASRARNIEVVSETMLPAADVMKKIVEDVAARVSIAPLSAQERKRIAEVSLDALRQMARNQIPGYDVRPALDNVALTLAAADLAPVALETLAQLPGTAPQVRLADVVLDPRREQLRLPAARELNRHVQRNGMLLPRGQFDKVKALYQNEDTNVALRTELAYFLGALRTTPLRDGRLMFDFQPDPPAAPAAEKKEGN